MRRIKVMGAAAWAAAAMLALAAGVGGCVDRSKPRALPPTAFISGKPTIGSDPLSRVDNPGMIEDSANRPSSPGRPEIREGEAEGISRTVRENVKNPSAQNGDLSAQPGTAPAPAITSTTAATIPSGGGIGASSGQYLTVGGIVAEVNGKPIYTDKLLASIRRDLYDTARRVDSLSFREYAKRKIADQLGRFIDAELQLAAAEQALDEKQKEFASLLTMQWRQQQIAEAGGSLELAKRGAAKAGMDFEEMTKEQRSVMLRRLYAQKKLWPRVQVTADDLRIYYDQNKSREFTTPGEARFRLIKISVKDMGDRDRAKQKIQELRDRAVRGEDFAAIASSTNHDPRLLKSGGDLGGPIQKGAFALEPVEQAVWATPIAEVTPIVEMPDAFYIAKVEEKRAMRVIPFDEEGVQEKIRHTLEAQQFNALIEEEILRLKKNYSVRSDPQMLSTAVDVAMQDYHRWTGR